MYFSLLNSIFGSANKQQKHFMQVIFSENLNFQKANSGKLIVDSIL